jgi:adenine-specific DNA-methyltransferase
LSTNVSRQKRKELTEKIKEIHKYIATAKQDENTRNLIAWLSEIEKEINARKFGLVFEEHREAIDETLETHTPVLTENKKLYIDNGGQVNFLIEGDNLAALQLLLKTHKGKIDVIYIDPPYNNGGDYFVYDDKYIEKTDAFRHSKWLSLMNIRLKLAKQLLHSAGVIFISINDTEQSHLKILCDDIFGCDNFCGQLIWQKKAGGGQTDEFFVTEHEYILVYRKSPKFEWLDALLERAADEYKNQDENGIYKKVKLAKWGTGARKEDRPTMYFPIETPDGKNMYPVAPDGNAGRWRVGKPRMDSLIANKRIHWDKADKDWIPYEKVYYTNGDKKIIKFRSIIYGLAGTGDGTKILTTIFGKKDVFQNPKPVELIQELLTHTKNEVVLDFFAGSGTTGHATLELNKDGGKRRFILCTNNENNICRDVTYERIKRVIKNENYAASLKYYKIDYIPISGKLYYEYADKLLEHIRELVELENGINFLGNDRIAIILTDEEMEEFVKNMKNHKNCRKLYRAHNVLVSGEQAQKLKSACIKVHVIPDYYYGEMEI